MSVHTTAGPEVTPSSPAGEMGDLRTVRRVDACPVCGGRDLRPFALIAWPLHSLHFAQARCRDCGLLISQPQVSVAGAEQYYSRAYYEDCWPDADGLWTQNTRDHARHEWPLIQQLWADWPPPAGGKAVEIGCGYGIFLGLLSRSGYRVSGCDMSRRAAEYCRTRSLNVVQATLPGAPFPAAAFDIVLSLQVVEHVHDPRAFVGELVGLARPGGIVVIATEDALNSQYAWDRLRAHATGRIPRFRSSTDHTFVFQADHLERLLSEAGCDDVRCASYSYAPQESLHWRLYKGLFRTLDRMTGHGDFLMAVARRCPAPLDRA